MGLWSEWHYTAREISGWTHIITSPQDDWWYESIHQYHRPNALSLLYHTFWCKSKRQHISLKFIYNVTLIWLPAAGFVWRWLLWCFESRPRAAVARTDIFHSCGVYKMRERHHAQLKMKSWTVNRVMWLLCEHGVEASKDWVFVVHFIRLWCKYHDRIPRYDILI